MNPIQEKHIFQSILVKFIINLPSTQLEDANRLAYQAEKAFYYYLDEILNNSKPQNWDQQTKEFLNKLAHYSPPSLRIDPRKLILKIHENKPVCGAIIFNQNQTKVLVIKVRNKFGFPKGKWNQHEKAEECAAREVYEQTGVYIHNKIDPTISIEFQSHGSLAFFFVARGLSQDDRLRIDTKQIDGIFWMRIEDLRANQKRLVERSRVAWERYEQITNQATQMQRNAGQFELFLEKYGPKEQVNSEDISENPFLNFKFDTDKLKLALLTAFGSDI